jgi:hypothetical protein
MQSWLVVAVWLVAAGGNGEVPIEPLPPGLPVPAQVAPQPERASVSSAMVAESAAVYVPGPRAVRGARNMPGSFPCPRIPGCCCSYQLYRANFFVNGYDYLTQFDYPWHTSCSPVPALGPPAAEPTLAPIPLSASRATVRRKK